MFNYLTLAPGDVLRKPLFNVNPPHHGQDVHLDVSAETDVNHPQPSGQDGEVERLRRHPEHEPDGVRRHELVPPLSHEVVLTLCPSHHVSVEVECQSQDVQLSGANFFLGGSMKLLSPTGGSQIVGFTGPLIDKFLHCSTRYISTYRHAR